MVWNDSHLCSSWFLQVSHLGWGSVGITLPPLLITGQVVWLPVSWGIGVTSTSPSSSGMLALGCSHRLPSSHRLQVKLTRPLELSLWTSRGYFIHILMINELQAQPRAQQWEIVSTSQWEELSQGMDYWEKNGFFWWFSRSTICLQCRRCRFAPLVGKIPWRRIWQPTPVLPGESQGQRSLADYGPWSCKEWIWLSTQVYREENNFSCFYPPLGPKRRPQNYKHKDINVKGLSVHKAILPGGTWWFNVFKVMYYSKRERVLTRENIPKWIEMHLQPSSLCPPLFFRVPQMWF